MAFFLLYVLLTSIVLNVLIEKEIRRDKLLNKRQQLAREFRLINSPSLYFKYDIKQRIYLAFLTLLPIGRLKLAYKLLLQKSEPILFIELPSNIDFNALYECNHCRIVSRHHQGRLTSSFTHDGVCPFCDESALTAIAANECDIILAPFLPSTLLKPFAQQHIDDLLDEALHQKESDELQQARTDANTLIALNEQQLENYKTLISKKNT